MEGDSGSAGVCSRRGRRGGEATRGRGATFGINKGYNDPDVNNVLPAFTPTRPPGVHFGQPVLRNLFTTAADFFLLFFTEEMIQSLVDHTNSYAYIQIAGGTHTTYTKSDGSWQETTPDEMKRLIAVLIYFGLVRVETNIHRYWSIKTLYNGLWARAIISRIRYKALMGFLHVVDPTSEVPGNKLRKVESFLNYFKERCKRLYQPKQNMAVDERMVKSRHHSGILHFIERKPIRWGIKLWVLADSSNGYTIDFDVYIGKDAGRNVSDNGLAYDVVMKLMQPYLHQGYNLFFDNFYTSVSLVSDLFDLGVPSSGTVRINRKGFPDSLKDVKKWAHRLGKGAMRWERVPPVLVVQWVDNKPVSLLTTLDNANDTVQVKRKKKINGERREVDVSQPKAISRYTQYMNAVDRSDQLLAVNSVSRKCYRWWKTLFFHLIDMAVVNGFILFKEHRAKFPDNEQLRRPERYSTADFREEIIRQFCDIPEYGSPPLSSKPPPAPVGQFDTIHMPCVSRDTRKSCYVCYHQGRGQLRISTYCSAPQCGKYLHITSDRNCFQEWHSREYHKH